MASLGDKAKELSERHGDAIELECICVSEHSPDTVKHSERISRQIFSPIHLDENGEVKPAAFDDASSQGLSVDRDSYSPLEEIHQRGELKARLDNEDEARIGKPARIYQGACVADVSDVRKLKARDVIWNYLSTHECVDCGESNPLVLEFDHVNGQKLRDVCTSKYYGVTITLQEVAKCEVRCANCHRKKTALQLGWWKDKL